MSPYDPGPEHGIQSRDFSISPINDKDGDTPIFDAVRMHMARLQCEAIMREPDTVIRIMFESIVENVVGDLIEAEARAYMSGESPLPGHHRDARLPGVDLPDSVRCEPVSPLDDPNHRVPSHEGSPVFDDTLSNFVDHGAGWPLVRPADYIRSLRPSPYHSMQDSGNNPYRVYSASANQGPETPAAAMTALAASDYVLSTFLTRGQQN